MSRTGLTVVANLVLAFSLAACTASGTAPNPAATAAPVATPAVSKPVTAPPKPAESKPPAAPAKKPTTTEELAMYTGADRQTILEEGASKEGSLTLYTSSTDAARRPLVEAFNKKYPNIKVDSFRASNEELVPRIVEEHGANRYEFDVLETTVDSLDALTEVGIMGTYKSPEMAQYPPDSLDPDSYFAPVRESYVGLGFNTTLLKRDEAPKQLDDLLDPRWKGKMAIAGSSTGVRFVGNVILTKGEEFLKKLGQQEIQVQKVSGRALADLVSAGEVPLSPTIFDSHVQVSQGKGAPLDWVPLEPTVTNLGVVGLAAKAPHPHAALLFIDFALSEEGQKVYVANGYGSARKGMGGTATDFKKRYLENDVKDYIAEFEKWQKLMNSTFVRS